MTDKLHKDAQSLLQERGGDPLVQAFIGTFYDHMNDQDIAETNAVKLFELSNAMTALLKQNKKDSRQIEVYTPTLEDHGWIDSSTIIHIIHKDLPFLIDSIAAELINEYSGINLFVHPLISVERDKKGKIESIEPVSKKNEGEILSCLCVELNTILNSKAIEELKNRIGHILDDVVAATSDWREMIVHVDKILEETESTPKEQLGKYSNKEYVDFIKYLRDDNFTFLGYRYVKISKSGEKLKATVNDSRSLGLLKKGNRQVISSADDILPDLYSQYLEKSDFITFTKSANFSTVHRRVPMDAITIKHYSKSGALLGEHFFLGLFTSMTYSRSVFDIPIVRQKANFVMEVKNKKQRLHNNRAIRHILEKYPRDELFPIEQDQLKQYIYSILMLQERQRTALFPRMTTYGRFVTCIVYVPKTRFETRMRVQILKMLEQELDGECRSFKVLNDDSPMVRIQLFILIKERNKEYDFDKIEEKLLEITQSWFDKLRTTFIEKSGNEDYVFDIIQKYQDAFPPAYTHHYEPEKAFHDINIIEKSFSENKLNVSIYRPKGMHKNKFRIKLYHPGAPVILSDILPILTDMGMRVISEIPNEIKPDDSTKSIWIHDLLLELENPEAKQTELTSFKEELEEAIVALWYGFAETDMLNSLIVLAGLNWRSIEVLRAYVKYSKQVRSPYSIEYVMSTLVQNPGFVKLFWKLFDIQFNPKNTQDSEINAAGINVEIDHKLEEITSIEQDKILRSINAYIRATQRTNFYHPGGTKSYSALSFKIKSNSLKDIPDPKPWVEIFVYSARVEGVHLRFGPIARGGLRWSDRFEDFRT